MLDLLVRYARSHGLVAEPGFAPKTVRWALVFDPAGVFLSAVELGDPARKNNPGRTFDTCPDLSQPEMKRGGAGCRHFLVDSADVVALLGGDPADRKLAAKHAYFAGLLQRAATAMPELAPLAASLADPAIVAAAGAALATQGAKPTDKVTLAIEGRRPPFPVESDAWHDWWRAFRRTLSATPAGAAESGPRMRCLASGELVAAAPTHPKIAGLADVGGLSMGDALASFKQDAFRSYGLEQSANAAVSEEMAAAYRAALNRLVRDGRRLAGARVAHWFKRQVTREDDPLSWLEEGDETAERSAQRRARRLLAAIAAGESPDLAANEFYALTLSGASGRVMVRDWMEGTFPELVGNVEAWFDHLAIARRDGAGLAPAPKFLAVLGALVRDRLDEVPAPLEARLWHAAVRRRAIPRQAAAQALARFRADVLQRNPLNHARVGLLKAFLIRRPEGGIPMQPYLDEDHPEAAYHCGRLLAMFAALQYRALGDVGAGVVQRYYAAASATPALVLGRLTRTAQFHLDKLDRGLARWHEGRIAETWGRIKDRVPATLDLEHQSLFALGYYQQIAADRARTRELATAAAEASTPADQETDDHA